jgi:hypothetical protein
MLALVVRCFFYQFGAGSASLSEGLVFSITRITMITATRCGDPLGLISGTLSPSSVETQ